MIIQCEDGNYYRNPNWTRTRFVVTVVDDKVGLLYLNKVKLRTARESATREGFYFKSLISNGETHSIIGGAWREVTAFEGGPKKPFPIPDSHSGKFSSMLGVPEEGEPVFAW